ncbi:hypothetical protein EC988_003749 [Linderina pennispora]|nr:hypothetical protein EC988_003749 [Linderina pennispora]
MAPILSMFVGATVGLGTGMYAMGLQGRAVLKPRISYAVYVSAGALIGYKYYSFKQYEKQLIEKRRTHLLEKRAQRLAEATAEN